jgi:hypothetical protein
MSVVDPRCSLLRIVCCWFDFVRCCGISRRRVNLGVVVRNPTPVGHPKGDRLLSKSRQRFRIMELGRYIILIGSLFAGCVCWLLVAAVWAACLLLIQFCSLLRHVCYWSGSLRYCDMYVIDPVLFVVVTCMLLIRFCWFLRYLT